MFMFVFYHYHQFKQLQFNVVEVHRVWGAMSDADSKFFLLPYS